MGTKTITIMDEAYGVLKREKGAGESFTDVILRFGKKTGTLADCFGMWKMERGELEKIRKELRKGWKSFDKSLRKVEHEVLGH